MSNPVTAIVKNISNATPTVKTFSLGLASPIVFRAGQWIDLFIPGTSLIGGYSIYTCPPKSGLALDIDIAVKYSNHPATKWMHTNCAEGSKCSVQVGGNVILESSTTSKPTLFIAGGIGISMIQLLLRDSEAKVLLMYSSRTNSELLFKNNLNQLAVTHQRFSWTPVISREEEMERITKESLNAVLKRLNPVNSVDTRTFLCGPPSMVDQVDIYLRQLGVVDISFERWW
eukprot:gene1818-4917_t